MDFTSEDISARTELSYARQALNVVKEMLFGSRQVGALKERADGAEEKMDDLLAHIDRAMASVREV